MIKLLDKIFDWSHLFSNSYMRTAGLDPRTNSEIKSEVHLLVKQAVEAGASEEEIREALEIKWLK